MVNFTDMDSKESVGVEEVKEELAKARVELGRKRREVEEAEAKVRKLEEQLDVLVKLEEEVGEVGAVNRAAGGEPGASPTLWTPNPKEVEEGGAVTRSSWGEPGASPTPWTPKPLPAGDERLLEEQVEGEGWGALTIPHLYLSSVSLPFL